MDINRLEPSPYGEVFISISDVGISAAFNDHPYDWDVIYSLPFSPDKEGEIDILVGQLSDNPDTAAAQTAAWAMLRARAGAFVHEHIHDVQAAFEAAVNGSSYPRMKERVREGEAVTRSTDPDTVDGALALGDLERLRNGYGSGIGREEGVGDFEMRIAMVQRFLSESGDLSRSILATDRLDWPWQAVETPLGSMDFKPYPDGSLEIKQPKKGKIVVERHQVQFFSRLSKKEGGWSFDRYSRHGVSGRELGQERERILSSGIKEAAAAFMALNPGLETQVKATAMNLRIRNRKAVDAVVHCLAEVKLPRYLPRVEGPAHQIETTKGKVTLVPLSMLEHRIEGVSGEVDLGSDGSSRKLESFTAVIRMATEGWAVMDCRVDLKNRVKPIYDTNDPLFRNAVEIAIMTGETFQMGNVKPGFFRNYPVTEVVKKLGRVEQFEGIRREILHASRDYRDLVLGEPMEAWSRMPLPVL